MELWQKLQQTEKPIWLYGMGNGADSILKVLGEKGITVQGVFASSGFVRRQQFHGFTVCSYEEAKEQNPNMIVLLCFGTSRDEVLQNIERIAKEQELYAPDVPVYGEGLFDLSYVKTNEEQFRKIYNLFADELSQKTFEAAVLYKISGKLDYLKKVEADIADTYQNLLCLSPNESYADIGAYTGDTVAEFLSFSGGAQKIWAFEPDRRSFRKLTENTQDIPHITLYHGAAAEKTGEVPFFSKGGRGSRGGEGVMLPCTSLDNLTAGEKVSFIKIDAEGMEKQVIEGAEKCILTHRPKMRIACYHRTEDLLAIPDQVLSLCGDYKLYLRKYKGVPAWDLEYYFL